MRIKYKTHNIMIGAFLEYPARAVSLPACLHVCQGRGSSPWYMDGSLITPIVKPRDCPSLMVPRGSTRPDCVAQGRGTWSRYLASSQPPQRVGFLQLPPSSTLMTPAAPERDSSPTHSTDRTRSVPRRSLWGCLVPLPNS